MSRLETEQEIGALDEMMRTEGWKIYFRNVVSTHRKFLLNKMNKAIENHEDRTVGEVYAQVKEVNGILNLASNRVKALREELKEGVDGTDS